MQLLPTTLRQIEAAYRRIEYPFLVVDDARRAQGRQGDSEFTYGNTPPEVVLELLEFASATEHDVFLDVGCGLGMPTVVASYVCARSLGIELLPDLVARARAVAAELALDNVSFEVADLKSCDLAEATLIYCYSTCLGLQTRVELGRRVAGTRPGTRILTVTHDLKHESLELAGHREMSWEGSTRTVYLHVRRP